MFITFRRLEKILGQMDVLDVSTHARAKGGMISTGIDVCSVMSKLRVYVLCLRAYNYVMVDMKLL